MPNVLHALFVAWQNPLTRRFYPVARLSQISDDAGQGWFEFAYIRGALNADQFTPFVSFPNLEQTYRAQDLFPMFANRLLSEKRADFPTYLAHLGLPSATTSPLLILSRSTGRRVTDTLELFPLPELEPEHGYRTWFWAHALRHLSQESHARLAALVPEEPVFPRCDPQNPVDSDAIELLSDDGTRIGFMPSYLLDDAHTLQQTCTLCKVFVERINPPPAPLQQRLLLRLEACWPHGFVPYATDRYQPISSEAATLLRPVLPGVD
jgi:hypothetical protein